ncbi:MAG TPA: hypothetical protein VNL18_11385, partial [Gemmatimonadales bacterium]|nr:hypothetical protein [Gemmatimonadales bacterium]
QVVVVAMIAVGCSSGGPPPTAESPAPAARVGETQTGLEIRTGEASPATSSVLAHPADSVWAHLPGVYSAMGIEAEVNEPATRRYGTARFTRRGLMGRQTSEWVRCGHQGAGPSAVSGRRIRLTILTTVRPEGADRSRLETEVTGEATTIEGTSTAPVRCVSTGEIERRLRDEMVRRLTGGRAIIR